MKKKWLALLAVAGGAILFFKRRARSRAQSQAEMEPESEPVEIDSRSAVVI